MVALALADRNRSNLGREVHAYDLKKVNSSSAILDEIFDASLNIPRGKDIFQMPGHAVEHACVPPFCRQGPRFQNLATFLDSSSASSFKLIS